MGFVFIKPLWKAYEYPGDAHADNLRVIGVGLPRTGTSSLKAALDMLGFGPCHHMFQLMGKPDRIQKFLDAYDGKETDFYELMKGYGSTVDKPTIDFYKEIQQAYPEAKLILTVRDSDEKWFQSYQSTIGTLLESNYIGFALYLRRPLRLHHRLAKKSRAKTIRDYGEFAPSIHSKHNEKIINENKGNNLLVFNVKEGWAPLCKFLQVDIPEGIPFPNVNDSDSFRRITLFARIFGSFCWFLLAVFIVFIAYIIMRIM